MRKEKGITLMVLIVTIIILLILLGVGTKVIIDGKLISSAEKAVNGTNNRIAEEQTEVNGLIGELTEVEQSQCEHEWGEWETIKTVTDKETGKRKRVCSKCGKVFEQDVLIYAAVINGYDPSKGEKGEQITSSYTSKGSEKGGTLAKDGTTDGSQGNGYKDQTFELPEIGTITKWQVVGQDNEGRLIIAASQAINTTENVGMSFRHEAGVINAVEELHKICSIYGQGKYADKTLYNLGDSSKKISGARCFEVDDVMAIGNRYPRTKHTFKLDKKEDDDKYYLYIDDVKTDRTSLTYLDETTTPKSIKTLSDGESVEIYHRGSLTWGIDKLTRPGYQSWVAYIHAEDCTLGAVGAGTNLSHFGILPGYYGYSTPQKIRPVVYLRADVKTTYDSETGEYTIVD